MMVSLMVMTTMRTMVIMILVISKPHLLNVIFSAYCLNLGQKNRFYVETQNL